jgi:dihydroxyacetone kinase-like protein
MCQQTPLVFGRFNSMGKSQLDIEMTREMFTYVSKRMVDSKDLLTDLDRAIGDSDHGIGMARGFEAVCAKLENQSYDSVGKLLQDIGTTLMMSIGGAAGAIFGTMFRGGASKLLQERELTSRVLSKMLLDGLDAVKSRGGARVNDKTMVDALEPAAVKSKDLVDAPLSQTLMVVTDEARKGMEQTKAMVATTGKAKTLGERSLGHPDPGSASTYLILKYMMEFTTASETEMGK